MGIHKSATEFQVGFPEILPFVQLLMQSSPVSPQVTEGITIETLVDNYMARVLTMYGQAQMVCSYYRCNVLMPSHSSDNRITEWSPPVARPDSCEWAASSEMFDYC